MTSLDELSIIKIFQKNMGKKKFVPEDVEVFNLGKTDIITKIDTLVESTDIPPGMHLKDAARKSIVACVSDFAAKGVKPRYGVISVNLPKSVSRSEIDSIAKGFKKACSEYNISILGGDTNVGREIVFTVCLFGSSVDIANRKGSKNADLIFVTGPFGYVSAGLDMLLLGKKKGSASFIKKCIRSVIKPEPRLDFGLRNKSYFSSSMDSSDGLSTTLNEMSRQSKKRFIIDNMPSMNDLESYAESQNADLENLVFHGGEEYEFVFTVSPKHRKTIIRNAELLKTPIIEIGYVALGRGVFVQKNNGLTRLPDLGWDHFR